MGGERRFTDQAVGVFEAMIERRPAVFQVELDAHTARVLNQLALVAAEHGRRDGAALGLVVGARAARAALP